MAMIMAMKIFGAAEGFRPSDVMLAKELAANTAQGPSTQNIKMMTSATLRLMDSTAH
jgi:hypothetical protein